MSLNLLADYADSGAEDSDAYGSDTDEKNDLTTATPSENKEETTENNGKEDENEVEKNNDEEAGTSTMPSFFSADCASSSDEEEEQPAVVTTQPRLLPSADRAMNKRVTSSVFSSDAQREEAMHNAMLSTHVDMVDKEQDHRRKTQQPCRAFKRGECRRGDKCRFAHGAPQPVSDEVPVVLEAKATLYKEESDVFAKRPRLV